MSILSPYTWPDELIVAPKDVLVLLVDLNERYHGAFERVLQAMHETLDLKDDPVSIKLKAVHPKAVLPVRKTRGSLGYDLVLTEDLIITDHETKIVKTGLVLADDLPAGICMSIRPRSSTFPKYGLLVGNSPGTVDQDYSGEIGIILHKVPVYRSGLLDVLSPLRLEAGTAVAQLVFERVELPEIEFVDEVNSTRDRGGFGSTGV